MVFSNRDKAVNHISECNKEAQKEYKSRYDWVGYVIHWELCEILNGKCTNGKCINHNKSKKIRNIKLSGTLRFKRFPKSRLEDQT